MTNPPLPAQVDIAIVTILPEEYEAVRCRLKNVRQDPGTSDQPNQYAWVVGEIDAAHTGSYQVVLAMTANAGNTAASLGTSKTIARWSPRYVLLVGIAGGLPRDELALGDLVVSTQIVNYEYGKIDEGAFKPRPNFVHQVDGALLRAALSLSHTNWRSKLGRRSALLPHRLGRKARPRRSNLVQEGMTRTQGKKVSFGARVAPCFQAAIFTHSPRLLRSF
jgi:nucleoside phosphorylase